MHSTSMSVILQLYTSMLTHMLIDTDHYPLHYTHHPLVSPLPLSISTDRCTEHSFVSEQEQAQHHEHEEEEPDLVQGPLDLQVPPLPGVHVLCSDMVRARVVQACRQLATEH